MNNYRDIINHEFTHRKSINPHYSLRAFSRDLGINSGQLSLILNHRAGLSSKKAIEVAKKLGLDKADASYFKSLVEVEHGRSERIKKEALTAVENFKKNADLTLLSELEFSVISDWIHFAILSTMEHDQFDGTIDYLKKELDCDYEVIDLAVTRLLKLELIDFKRGKLVVSGNSFRTTSNIPSLALKKFHKQHLQKAIQSIDHVDVTQRSITNMTMAIDLERLDEAKEMIDEFRRRFCKVMENSHKNSTYSLNIQFIPLKGQL